MISYAQNAEDVVLARLFADRDAGRYVDIGAGDPTEASVTRHFYDRGWTGVNVEPLPDKAAELRRARPRDLTREVAVGAKPGRATLHAVTSAWGWSTLDDHLARAYREDHGWEVAEVEVEVVTLADLLDEHPGPVDFLKIDVEGGEPDVVAGGDWSRHRPRVVVVEATEPGTPDPSHEGWEPVLLGAGYRCALFDGLNRFYAQADDAEAMAALSTPANVFDRFERHDVVRQREELDRLKVERLAEIGYARRVEQSARDLRAELDRDAAYLASREEAIADLKRELAQAARYTAALEKRLVELEQARVRAERRLADARCSDPAADQRA